jgi:hypothetical protein
MLLVGIGVGIFDEAAVEDLSNFPFPGPNNRWSTTGAEG